MSASTLKRKLQKHDTHFQEQLDQARKHVALYLYQVRGYGNEEVAAYLQFNDTTNFRRSFKRSDRPGAEPGAADVRAVARRRSATRGRIRDGSPQA